MTRSPLRSGFARTLTGLTLVASMLAASSTHAATPSRFGGEPPAPPMPSSQGESTPPAAPPPDSVIEQARAQSEGWYGTLARPRTAGQVQEIWDDADVADAVYTTALCEACTYKVRLREFMVTVIELPRGETIEAVDLGDKAGFTVQSRGARRLALRPAGQGYDTSLVVYGKSGRLYPFYLRAESFNSVNLPDLIVRIEGSVEQNPDVIVLDLPDLLPAGSTDDKSMPPSPADARDGDGSGAAGRQDVPGARDILQGLTETVPSTPAGDFVASAPFDPNALRGWGDYELWGDKDLRPETVFRDDQFTYIRFGKRWKDIELPTAYVVVDGIDELVNTRVQGQTYIVESTRPLITLKSGESFLCIRYEGDEA